MSPFKKITQQLGALDLKSPDLEDFATPMGPAPDLWPQIKYSGKSYQLPSNFKTKSPSSTDISAISSIQNTVKNYTQICRRIATEPNLHKSDDYTSCSLPIELNSMKNKTNDPSSIGLKFSETHFDVNGEVSSTCQHTNSKALELNNDADCQENTGQHLQNCDSFFNHQLAESKNEILQKDIDENGFTVQNCSIVLGHNGAFLDTHVSTTIVYVAPQTKCCNR